jgi:hypothetical protein
MTQGSVRRLPEAFVCLFTATSGKNLGVGVGEYDKIPNHGEAKGVAGSKNKHRPKKLQKETIIGGYLGA